MQHVFFNKRFRDCPVKSKHFSLEIPLIVLHTPLRLTSQTTPNHISILLHLYKAIIRPHIEYTIQKIFPLIAPYSQVLELDQKIMTKLMEGLPHVPYETAHRMPRLFLLARRRTRGNLISRCKIASGHLNFPRGGIFDTPHALGFTVMLSKFINNGVTPDAAKMFSASNGIYCQQIL